MWFNYTTWSCEFGPALSIYSLYKGANLEFTIYTDGGCSGNKRDSGCPGGFGYVVLDPGENSLSEGGGKRENTTNNRMEMLAVIKGLEELKIVLDQEYDGASKHDAVVKTDSRYICDNFEDYLPEWKKNGWKKSKGGMVLNKDLWKKIDKLAPEFRSFRFQWVKGHAKDKWNNLADSIVQNYIKGSKLSPQI